MGDVVHAVKGGVKDQDGRRILVDGQVLEKLVISPLDEGRFSAVDNMGPTFGSAGSDSHRGLLRDSHVDVMIAQLGPHPGVQAQGSRHPGGDDQKTGVLGRPLHQILACQPRVILPRVDGDWPLAMSKGPCQCQSSSCSMAGR